MTSSTLLVWVVTCAIWSTVWLFIKLGVRDVPPVTFAAFRLAVALAVLVPLTLAPATSRCRAAARTGALIGGTGVILLGVNYALLNWGIQYISSGLTAVLQAMTPVFGFVFAHLLLDDERMTAGKGAGARWSGCSASPSSSGISSTLRRLARVDWQHRRHRQRGLCGDLVRGDAAARTIASIPRMITAGQMTAALVPAPALRAAGRRRSAQRALVDDRRAVRVCISRWPDRWPAAWLNYWLLKRIGATKLLSMGLVEPLIAVLLGAAMLGETDVFAEDRLLAAFCILPPVPVAVVLDVFRKRA